MRITWITTTLGICLVAAIAVVAGGPGASAMESHGGSSAEAPDPADLWSWLDDAEYEHWAPYPGLPAEFYEGSRPHGALLKTYVNRVGAANPADPPHGTVIVKENYSADEELAAITVMKRIEGYDPEHRDWWYAKYTASGDVAQQNGNAVAGKVPSCRSCHANAGGDDYVFANDDGH